MERFSYLDGFRGLLASIVALSHIYGATTAYSALRPWRGASLAVDCFFVMSGFVLAYTIGKSGDSFRAFFLKRIFRLFPLHLFALFWTVVVVSNNLFSNGYVPSWFPPIDFLPVTLNFFALTNIAWSRVDVFNDPSWSVSVEIFVSVFILHYLASNKKPKVALFLAFLAYFYLFYYDGFKLRSWSPVGFGVNGGLLRGIGGVLVGYAIYEANWAIKFQKSFEWLLALALIFALHASDGSYDVVGLLIFIALLSSVRGGEGGGVKRFVSSSPFVWLGEISYSLYLMHTPVILLMAPGGGWSTYLGALAPIFVFTVAVSVSAVVYYGFETPIRLRLYRLIK